MSWLSRNAKTWQKPGFVVREIAVPSNGEIAYGFDVYTWNGITRNLLGTTIDPAEALSAGEGTTAVLVRLYHLPDGTYVRGKVLERVTLGLTKPEAQS